MQSQEAPPAYTELAHGVGCNAGATAAQQNAAFEKRQYQGTLPVGYIAVEASQSVVYLLRSDGIVDRSTGGGTVGKQLVAEAPHTYVGVSSGQDVAYLLRSDGCVLRTTKMGNIDGVSAERRPPPGITYTQVSSGPVASYFLRSDGQCDRATMGGHVTSTMQPPGWPEVHYTKASAGLHASYLLRSDGVVDRIRGGAVESELRCGGGAGYIELVDQTEVQSDKSNNPSPYFYIIRSDGMADRYKTYFGTLTKEMHPRSARRLSPVPLV